MRLADSQSRRDQTATARKAVATFAACVYEPKDIVEVRRLPSGQSTWHRAGRLAETSESLFNENEHGQHIYVGANPRFVEGGTRSKDVACARCLFVDFDDIDPETARSRCHNTNLPTPTLTIASGHGVHAYWRLSDPVTDMILWSILQRRLIALLGSDSAIHDPARLMRLPGFINHKQPVAMCQIIDDDPLRIYDLKSLMPLLYSVITESDYAAQYQAVHNDTAQPKKLYHSDMSSIQIAKLSAQKWPNVNKGGRNSKSFQNAAYLVKNLGLTGEQAWPILRKWNMKNRPPLPERELRQALQNATIYGRHPVASKALG